MFPIMMLTVPNRDDRTPPNIIPFRGCMLLAEESPKCSGLIVTLFASELLW